MNSQLPKVSVIIPCYNCEKWINKCLDSLVKQDYEGNIEIICIDDCSKDNTVKIIEEYIENTECEICLLKNKENLGPGKSRNIAIEHSTGEWISFCDSDDWFDKNFISLMIENAITNSSDLVMCNYKKVIESNNSVITVDYLKDISDNYSNEECIIYSKASLCLLMVKREIMIQFKIPDLRNGEDIAVIPVLESMAKKITFIKNAPYNYLIRKESASNTVTDKVFYSLCSAYDYIFENLGSNYDTAKEYLGIRTLLYGATMNGFKANISTKEIKNRIKKFVSIYPKWYKNNYMNGFSSAKRIYLLMIRLRCYPICRALAYLHRKLSV